MSTYRVGTAVADITPPIGMPYLGWNPRHQPFKGVNDPLLARAACIEAGGEKVIIVSSDTISLVDTLLGPDRSFIGEIMQEIECRTGLPPSNIMLASNHIHSSAETVDFRPLSNEYPRAHEWLEGLQNALVDCALKAFENTFEARLKIGKGSAPGLSMNRRGDDCLDEDVTVLLFEADGCPKLAMVNYACHPVIMQVQDKVSADYAGVMTSTVERTVDGLHSCMFLLGACGDINPVMGDSRNYADAEWLGIRLADEVIRIIGEMSADGYPVEPAIIRAAREQVDFPSRPLPSPDELPPDEDNEEALMRIAEGTGPFRGTVQAIRIGGAQIVAVSGEIFCSTGKTIKEICQPLTGIPVGYSNGYLGYFVPPYAWPKGGYEVKLGPWSKVGPEAEAVLMESIGRITAGWV